jgi:hypothetical protein
MNFHRPEHERTLKKALSRSVLLFASVIFVSACSSRPITSSPAVEAITEVSKPASMAEPASTPTRAAPAATPQDKSPGNEPDLFSMTPVIAPVLSIEEYELVQRPQSDPRFFEPVNGSADEILAKHATERVEPVGIPKLAFLEDGQRLWAEVTAEATYEMYQSGEYPEDFQGVLISITQDGEEIFTTKAPGLTIDSFRGLWVYEDHWSIEVIRLEEDTSRALTWGEIYKDGQSLNERYGYAEMFGFQLMHDKPFYFYERDGRIGAVYDGEEIPLGYEQVLHYGCCSEGVLNAIKYKNMVSFFALREGKWFYVEIGVFE